MAKRGRKKPRGRLQKSIKKVKQETWTTIVLAFIALLALCFSIDQGCETRKYYRLSTIPKLKFYTQLSTEEKDIGVFVENVGLGPASIESIVIKVKGKYHEISSLDEVMEAGYELGLKRYPFVARNYFKGIFLKENERSPILIVPIKFIKNNNELEKIRDTFRKMEIIVKYESIYGMEFTSTSF
jgi:hypothetical protein